MPEEILDIVDKSDKVIGKMKRSEIYNKGLSCFRVINVFLKNSKGQLWIPRRTPEKKLFPSCLDMSVGGHVSSNESYDEALKREVVEELGKEASALDFKFIGKLTPHEHGVSAFMKVYQAKTDRTPNYNKNDFVESYWFEPREVLNRIEGGDKAKDDLPILIRHLFNFET